MKKRLFHPKNVFVGSAAAFNFFKRLKLLAFNQRVLKFLGLIPV